MSYIVPMSVGGVYVYHSEYIINICMCTLVLAKEVDEDELAFQLHNIHL